MQGSNYLNDIRIYKEVMKVLSDGMLVYNFGTGQMGFERYVMSKYNDIKFISCDINTPDEIIQNSNIEFILADVEKLIQLEKKANVITFFELIEHIDKTDVLLQNCFNNLRDDGYLVFSFPNLSSIYCRLELLLGFQPHSMEVSNEKGNFGTGVFGRMNNASNISIHHIRGITTQAMKELVEYHGFTVRQAYGFSWRSSLWRMFPSFAPINIFVCQKKL